MFGLNYIYNHLYLVPSLAFLSAVIIKAICVRLGTGKFNLVKSLGSGGMPSAHSAVISSITTAVAIKHGVESDLFAIAITLTVIIIYDAVNVRFEAGRLGKEMNKMTKTREFKETLGHLPSEAFAGAVLGIFVAVACYCI